MNKEKLTANILFSGIGCQERGIQNTGLFDLDVISTSDIDKDAVLSYAAVHCGLTEEIINSEDLFKKFYADKNALKCCNFNSLTYNQAWQCVKEYAVDGYSSSMQEYIEQGIVK